jgi:hypothetical protein
VKVSVSVSEVFHTLESTAQFLALPACPRKTPGFPQADLWLGNSFLVLPAIREQSGLTN